MSRIIKSSHYLPSDGKIILAVKAPSLIQTDEAQKMLQETDPKIISAEETAGVIIRDAEEMAQKILQDAAQQGELLKQQASAEIDQWWEQKKLEAEALFAETRDTARQEGLLAGIEEGKAIFREEEREKIEAAGQLLENAHRKKEQIFAEAEPFLVKLSVEIAKKVIGAELASSEEKVLEVARRVLRRSRIHGEITLSVNHRYYDFIEEHRSQLLALLDGQAELMILPDYTVQDEGCVVRTPLGSVDARIDTQLSEIKQVLLEIARGSETDANS